MVKAMKAAGWQYCPSIGLFSNANGMYMGSVNVGGYVVISFKNSREYGHRLAWAWQTGEEPLVMDHTDGIKFNNKFSNLANGTYRQNSQNKESHRSGHILGSCQLKDGRFKSQIRIGSRVICLGVFEDVKDAHQAYMSAVPFVNIYKNNTQFRAMVLAAAGSETGSAEFFKIGMKLFERALKNAQGGAV
jgi:hypothetical protein